MEDQPLSYVSPYDSREEILKGDRVLLHGEPGEIEFVVNGRSSVRYGHRKAKKI